MNNNFEFQMICCDCGSPAIKIEVSIGVQIFDPVLEWAPRGAQEHCPRSM
jgi:hypothetical protein